MADSRWRMVSDSSLTMNNVIMMSLLLFKIINVFANFLILSDTLQCEYFSLWGKNHGIGFCQYLPSTMWLHNVIKLRHCVNHIMPRCWKFKEHIILCYWVLISSCGLCFCRCFLTGFDHRCGLPSNVRSSEVNIHH